VRNKREQIQLEGFASVLLLSALLFATLAVTPSARAQTPSPAVQGPTGKDKDKKGDADNFNSPPFDFNNDFYRTNGVDPDQLNANGQRFGFGSNRLTGPPAGPGQVNWVVDNSNTDPDRNNVRILATTGGYKDDTGSPTQFINIIAFLNDRTFFTPENRDIPQGPGNARGVTMEDIASTFEAYAGLRQVGPDGVFHPTPCAPSLGDPTLIAAGNCFSVASVATPNLRQDWRFSTNRNAIDGSGFSNGLSTAPNGGGFSYNGDNLVGLWIITYFWYNAQGFGPGQTADCNAALNFIAARNGLTLDGTPLIKTGAELHFVEGALQGNEVNEFPAPPATACAMEGNLARDRSDGSEGGPVWLVCPSIPDPTRGGIAPDAFADIVRKPDGTPLDPQISASFNCLQKNGLFCGLVNGAYMVKNQNSNLFWDGSSPGGSTVQLDALNVGAASQLWTFTANPDGTFRIVNKASGLALTSPLGSKVSGTALIQTRADSDLDERWIVTAVNNGFRIASAASRLAIDATTPVPNSGAFIVQSTPTGDDELPLNVPPPG
jgi:hypothetical protein